MHQNTPNYNSNSHFGVLGTWGGLGRSKSPGVGGGFPTPDDFVLKFPWLSESGPETCFKLSPIPPIIPPPPLLWSTIWTMFIVLHLPTGRSQDCLSLITTFHYQITKLEKAWTRSPVKVIICVVNIWISVVLSEFRHNLSDILGRGET